MEYVRRLLEEKVRRALGRGRSVLLLGPRQTGKTTLVGRFDADLSISFIRPDVRQRYEKAPELLLAETEALKPRSAERLLIVLDEVQKVPAILDVVQDICDRRIADVILTGSSARKLHRGGVNLLPGRIVAFRLDPLMLSELPATDLHERLVYGALPGILAVDDLDDREADLESYVTTYLEEEIRAEAAVRNLGDFARFLELAASDSGNIVNMRKLSQEIGVAHTTIGAYYRILTDCLVAERIEPITHSKTRRRLTRSAKYIFFDLGVRRVAAREGTKPPRETLGRIFEQFVGLELLRHARIASPLARIRFWRDPDGPEADWIVDHDGAYTPVEVKWTETPVTGDVRHLETFLAEYPSAREGYLVCRIPRRVKLGERIVAVPWQSVGEIVTSAIEAPSSLSH